MRHLDLFAGIGGFALAAGWMGWQTVLAAVSASPSCFTVNLPQNSPLGGLLPQSHGNVPTQSESLLKTIKKALRRK
jgi:site-specific DNA-cytosine methylase